MGICEPAIVVVVYRKLVIYDLQLLAAVSALVYSICTIEVMFYVKVVAGILEDLH